MLVQLYQNKINFKELKIEININLIYVCVL